MTHRLSALGVVALAIVTLAGAVRPFALARSSPRSRDYYAIDGLKARLLPHGGPARLLGSPELLFSHPDYPILHPRLLLLVGAEGPDGDTRRAGLIGAVALLVTLGLSGVALARAGSPPLLTLGTLALLAWRPIGTSATLLAQPEPLLTLFLTWAVLACARFLETGSHVALLVASVGFGLAAATKAEGIAAALGFAIAVTPRLVRARDPRLLAATIPGLLLAVEWPLRVANHSAGRFEYGAATLRSPARAITDLWDAAVRFASTAAESPETLPLLAAALALVLWPDRVGRAFRTGAAFPFTAWLAAVVFVYAVTPYGRAWQIAMSAIRILTVWSPLALIALARLGRGPISAPARDLASSLRSTQSSTGP